MNSHSNIWNKRRRSLHQKESQIESELEAVSSDFEGKATRVMIGAAIVGVVVFGITLAIKGSRKKEPKRKEKPSKQKVDSSSKDFKSVITEKVTMTILTFVLTYLSNLMAASMKKSDEKKD